MRGNHFEIWVDESLRWASTPRWLALHNEGWEAEDGMDAMCGVGCTSNV